ncbi:MAG: hypothetical protein WC719_02745 [Patescibacteria group bacterium]|jgi:hypothetical protein
MKKFVIFLVVVSVAMAGFSQEKKELLELVSGPEGISIDSLDGQETILKSKEIYSFINSKFQEWGLDQPSPPTGKTIVDVYKLKGDATFAEVFASISGAKGERTLSQAQINNFSKNHQELSSRLEDQLFFFFQANGEYWVASLCVRSTGRPTISPLKLSYDRSWHPSVEPEINFYFVIPRCLK